MKRVILSVWRRVQDWWRMAVLAKRAFMFVGALSIIALSYYWATENFRYRENLVVSAVVFWLVTVYLLLPRIHRILSRLYVPNYFIGRVRTNDGLLADPVNLAVRGSGAELEAALAAAGWQKADELSIKSAFNIARATLFRRSYPNAPVMDLFLFNERHVFAYQKEVNGNPAKRHHVRFWKVPKDMYLPGGYKVDWIAAATYDNAVGISPITWQITHSIDGDVDEERDYLVATLEKTGHIEKNRYIKHFFPQYSHFNGINGRKFFTNGSMVVLNLRGKQK